MFKKILTYFVLSLVVLQSSMAISDAHQQHQSGAEHLIFDDSHQHKEGNFNREGSSAKKQNDQDTHSDISSSQKWDCHHCCHCHGHFCPAILASVERILLNKNSSPVPDYAANIFPEAYEAFIRPPKA